MTEAEIERIEKLLAAITPGEWRWYSGGLETKIDEDDFEDVATAWPIGIEITDDDADFIAESPTIVRALLDEVRRLRAEWRKGGVDV